MHLIDIIRLNILILTPSMPIKSISILGGETIDVGVAILNHTVQGLWKIVKMIGAVAVKYIQIQIQVSTLNPYRQTFG